jgi:hypothetical protein
MDFAPPLEITFTDGVALAQAAVPSLQAMFNFVRDSVIAPLAKFL